MKISWRYWISSASSWNQTTFWLFSRNMLRHVDALFYVLKDGRETPIVTDLMPFFLVWLSRYMGHPCVGACVRGCVHLYMWRVQEVMRGIHRAPTSGHLGTTRAARRLDRSATHWMLEPSPQSVWALDSTPLLPKWAMAAAELQLCILHLLNVRGHPGEKV